MGERIDTRVSDFDCLTSALDKRDYSAALVFAYRLGYPTLASALKVMIDAEAYVQDQMSMFDTDWAS